MFFIGKSDVGKRRTTNQDSFSLITLDKEHFLCTVCDGMGGANGGNIASSLAISVYTEYIADNFRPDKEYFPALMREALSRANTVVYNEASDNQELKGMGTTLVSALICPDRSAYVINVGDSRLYTINGEDMVQITKDHSYVQYLVDMGQITIKEAESASIKNIIIRSVGNEKEANPDLFTLALPDNGYILLCSDGLSSYVGREEIRKEINAVSQNELELNAERLIKLANDAGGADNVTVILGKLD